MTKRTILFYVLGVASVIATSLALLYFSGPASVRKASFEHLHFRMQLLVDGKAVDFGQQEFQKDYEGGCSAEISPEPFHFHDNKDQIVHVHWRNMTGGLLLKYYGWNLIGGIGGILGYHFNLNPLDVHKLPIYGEVLPNWPEGAKMWVYTGDETLFDQRSYQDFLYQDFEQFFGKQSNINHQEVQSLFSRLLMPKAYAHGDIEHADGQEEQSLEEINNLIGNVVIFVQKEQPTADQVAARFQKLEPLSASTCGG